MRLPLAALLLCLSSCGAPEGRVACAEEAAALGPASSDKWRALDAGSALRACLSGAVLADGAPAALDPEELRGLWRTELLCPDAEAGPLDAPCWRARCGDLVPRVDSSATSPGVLLKIGVPHGDDPAPPSPCLEEARLTDLGPSTLTPDARWIEVEWSTQGGNWARCWWAELAPGDPEPDAVTAVWRCG